MYDQFLIFIFQELLKMEEEMPEQALVDSITSNAQQGNQNQPAARTRFAGWFGVTAAWMQLCFL